MKSSVLCSPRTCHRRAARPLLSSASLDPPPGVAPTLSWRGRPRLRRLAENAATSLAVGATADWPMIDSNDVGCLCASYMSAGGERRKGHEKFGETDPLCCSVMR